MDLEKIYKDAGAFLQGHFLLSSGNHSQFYLQSAKVLEDPQLAGALADELAAVIEKSGVEFDSICSPALGGILAGYELARAAKKRFIFTERVDLWRVAVGDLLDFVLPFFALVFGDSFIFF